MRILDAAAAVAAAAAVPITGSAGNNVMTVPMIADTVTITTTITSNSLEHITVLRRLLRVSLLILRVMQ